ncbi:LAMI_0C08944g1_1 [Lachancea mirantina]|uniref:LAMI_0C08944g1_1 n=1 Tax=Lachancea mirantina TaxID=1230905 RepID=A0A1G4J4X7_9SACH|nr:LAMI_0C08944g1_1 [Lachancea mirantina]
MSQVTPVEKIRVTELVNNNFHLHTPSTPQSDALGVSRPKRSPVYSPSVEQQKLVSVIATLLSALTSNFSNHKINNSKQHVAAFLTTVLKRSRCSKAVTILATFYFHKLYSSKLHSVVDLPEFSRCSRRIFLSCLILAHKYLNDRSFSMETWHCVSGLPSRDISSMERWCLNKLEYELFVTGEALLEWQNTVLHFGKVTPASNKRLRDEVDECEDAWMPAKRLASAVVH